MTNRQENKLSMYLAVQGVCNTHTTTWNGVPAFVNAMNAFENVIERIQEAYGIQNGKITGITADKQKEEEEMITHTIRVAGAVYAYAAANGNNTLMARVDYSPSTLRKSRDTELAERCRGIYTTANEHLAALGEYGVDAAMLTQLQSEINDFAALVSSPREAVVTRSEATGRLAELFQEGDSIVKNQMDPLAKQFEGEGAFYNQYRGARAIIDLGKRTQGTTEED